MVRQGGRKMRKESFVWPTDRIAHVMRNEASRLFYTIAFPTFCMVLGLSVSESVSAECLKSPQQLLEKKVSDRWTELHQKDKPATVLGH
jgi:hypothetical protein